MFYTAIIIGIVGALFLVKRLYGIWADRQVDAAILKSEQPTQPAAPAQVPATPPSATDATK